MKHLRKIIGILVLQQSWQWLLCISSNGSWYLLVEMGIL